MSTLLSFLLLLTPAAQPQDGSLRIAVPLHEEPSEGACALDPRTPIDAEHTPGDADSLFRIDAPGSYYLPGNATGKPGLSGIEVAASDVTIDLMGFTLTGKKLSLGGIVADGVRERVSIRSGVVTGFGGDGVDLQDGFECRVLDLRVVGNGGSGVVLGKSSIVQRCTASDNGDFGLKIGTESLVADCVATENQVYGITVGGHSRVERCVAKSNLSSGIYAGGKSCVSDCVAAFNGKMGITIAGYGEARRNIVSWNTKHGIEALTGSLLESNTALSNGEFGIRSNGLSHVLSNRMQANGAPGVGGGLMLSGLRTVVEDNVVIDNQNVGFLVEHTANVLRRNAASGNTVNWAVAVGNVCQVLVANAGGGVLGDSGGAPMGLVDPNANYTY